MAIRNFFITGVSTGLGRAIAEEALRAPPTRLLLGKDAFQLVREDRKAFEADAAAWEALSLSTDFD